MEHWPHRALRGYGLRLEQRREPLLLKVLIRGERIRNAALSHKDETDRIADRVALIEL